MIQKGALAVLALALATPTLAACSDSKSGDDKANATASPSGSQGTDTPAPEASSGPAAGGSSPKPSGSLKAVKLAVPDDLRGALQDTYFETAKKTYPKEKQDNLLLPTHILFGKVTGANGGVEFYAVADIGFKDNPMSRQDGPHVWKKDDSQTAWAYGGDTGGNLCAKVPPALVKTWGKTCS
ncbi:hypothetical protein [Actinomadura rupiterrae]|uniref:hypothetical protein n=1 Tax=Actinomadura rupiterrae TaxID=559627 RepID=UPI0020A235BA|nr:hypothetical protein [Actinomadura rupiterrae]MCP2335109.1 hypothetical protein [Actinomadura rupiterrae]